MLLLHMQETASVDSQEGLLSSRGGGGGGGGRHTGTRLTNAIHRSLQHVHEKQSIYFSIAKTTLLCLSFIKIKNKKNLTC